MTTLERRLFTWDLFWNLDRGVQLQPRLRPLKPLTTTSFALLGLLAIQPWTTYELAKQMTRSLSFFWPRAESKLYEEPKNLVTRGLAETHRTTRGKRTSTVYSITPEGRRALAEWLSRPGIGPVVEFERMLQVYLADNGSREDLLRTIAAIRAEAAARIQFGTALAREYLEGRGPFPQRLHVQSLVFRFLWEYHHTLTRWAEWALREVAEWPDTNDAVARRGVGLSILRAFVEPPGIHQSGQPTPLPAAKKIRKSDQS